MSHDDNAISPDLDNLGSLAVRLWHARSAVPMTQDELAERAGIPGGQSAIAHYEAGRREPSLANLRRLVCALGCGADYLLATRPGTDADYGAPRMSPQAERGQRIDATESELRRLGVGPSRALRCAELAEEEGEADPAIWHRACVDLVHRVGPDGFSALVTSSAVESFRVMLRAAVVALQRPAATTDPRAALLRDLANGMRVALATGDVAAARIVHDAIGRLLCAPSGDGGDVIDLATERDRRGV